MQTIAFLSISFWQFLTSFAFFMLQTECWLKVLVLIHGQRNTSIACNDNLMSSGVQLNCVLIEKYFFYGRKFVQYIYWKPEGQLVVLSSFSHHQLKNTLKSIQEAWQITVNSSPDKQLIIDWMLWATAFTFPSPC